MVMYVISSVLVAVFCFGFMFVSNDNDLDNVRTYLGKYTYSLIMVSGRSRYILFAVGEMLVLFKLNFKI